MNRVSAGNPRDIERPWLPQGHSAAVCFTIDDVHPGRAATEGDSDAGGELGNGALGHVEWLLNRHPKLHVTLFVTADWRELSPTPSRHRLARIPWIRDHVYLTETLPAGTMRISKHPQFVEYLRSLPRTDCALHGLHHVNKGLKPTVEFAGKSVSECERRVRQAMQIFQEAGLPCSPGMCPPSWYLSPELAQACRNVGLSFVSSARDILTPVTRTATNHMSGMRGLSLIYTQSLYDGKLIHFTTNFQATSAIERARDIVKCGGVLAIKAHIMKRTRGYVAKDGLDERYREYLDRVFSALEDEYGESLWWTSMAEISERCLSVAVENEHGTAAE